MKTEKENKQEKETKQDLRIILDYILENEENHFLENDKPKNHIYNNALRVNKWFNGLNKCCGEIMTDIKTFSYDKTRINEKCFICLECGHIKEENLILLDDEELLSLLENNGLEESKLYKELEQEENPKDNKQYSKDNEKKAKDSLSKIAKGEFK